MAYEEKTDWLPDDPINEDDVNRWEKGIKTPTPTWLPTKTT